MADHGLVSFTGPLSVSACQCLTPPDARSQGPDGPVWMGVGGTGAGGSAPSGGVGIVCRWDMERRSAWGGLPGARRPLCSRQLRPRLGCPAPRAPRWFPATVGLGCGPLTCACQLRRAGLAPVSPRVGREVSKRGCGATQRGLRKGRNAAEAGAAEASAASCGFFLGPRETGAEMEAPLSRPRHTH